MDHRRHTALCFHRRPAMHLTCRMTSEPDLLFAVVQFDGTGQRAVRRVVAPFPDRCSAAAYAIENDIHFFTVSPMAFAVPTTVKAVYDLPGQRHAPS